MKNILVITNMYPSKKFPHYGTFVKNTCNILSDLGYQVKVISLKKHTNKLIKAIAYINFYIKSYFACKNKKYNCIYAHYISHSTLPIIKALKKNKMGKKIILNAHGNDILPDRNIDMYNINRSKAALEIADLVIVPSKYFKDVLIDKYLVKPEIIKVFPSGGIDKNVMKKHNKKESKEQLKLDVDTKYIGFVSRIEKDKGYDDFINAINIIKDELNDYKILMVGSGEEDHKLNKLIEDYKLKEKVVLIPFMEQEKLAYFYSAIDLFVLPTKRKSESLSLVGIEAFACSTLCVINTLYGPGSYADSSNCICYKELDDGKTLADKIIEAINLSEDKKKVLIRNAHDTALKFDKEVLKIKLDDIFSNI